MWGLYTPLSNVQQKPDKRYYLHPVYIQLLRVAEGHGSTRPCLAGFFARSRTVMRFDFPCRHPLMTSATDPLRILKISFLVIISDSVSFRAVQICAFPGCHGGRQSFYPDFDAIDLPWISQTLIQRPNIFSGFFESGST